MKAALFDKYGPPEVLYITDVSKPVPNDNEVLIKIVNSAVNAADYRIRGANFPRGFTFFAMLAFGLTGPRNKILGNCFSGIIEEVGKNVSEFKIGDEVCGMSGMKMGTYAEFIAINEKKVILKPKDVSFEDAAGVLFGGTTALYYVRNLMQIKAGQKVLVNGASGAVGTNAVQIAKYYGAEVTGVCSTDNVELVKSLGADKVVDYKKENVLETSEKYDVIIDTVGNLKVAELKKSILPNGRIGLVVADLKDSVFSRKPVYGGPVSEKKEDMEFLLKLVSEGKLKVVIDKVYKLEQIVEAHRHADTGHKVGNIIIEI